MKVQVIPRFPMQVIGIPPVTVTYKKGTTTIELDPSGGGVTSKDYVDAADALKVNKSGDTMTGQLTLPTGPAAGNAVRKDYVDAADVLKADKAYVDTQDALKVAKAGDTMTGNLTLSGDPTAAFQAATKQYVDSLASGLVVKQAVVSATTANITLSGEQTIDGFLTSASRVLVKNQTTVANNGIYVSASGAWTRAIDVDNWIETLGAYTFVQNGTVNAGTSWVAQTVAGGIIDNTPMPWALFNSATGFLPLTGGTMSGFLTLNANPVSPLQAATKSYVDSISIPPIQPSFASRAAAQAFAPATAPASLQLRGYSSDGDGGASLYIKISTPSPVKAWHLQIVEGSWYELRCQDFVMGEQLGMSISSGNNSPAFQALIDYASAFGVRLKLRKGEYQVASGVTISNPIVIEGFASGIGPLTFSEGTAIKATIGFLSGDMITLNSIYASYIRHLRFDAAAFRSGGAAIRLNAVTNVQQGTHIEDCIFWRQYDCVYGSDAGATVIRDCTMANFTHAGGRFDSLRGVESSGGNFQNCVIFNEASGTIGQFGIYLAAGYAVIENCGIQGHDYGIFIDAKIGATGDFKIQNTSIDECRVWNIKTQEQDAAFAPRKIGIVLIHDCEFQNSNFLFGGVGNEGYIHISPGAHDRYLAQVIISDCSFFGNNINPSGNSIRIEDSLDTFVSGCKLNNRGAFGGGVTGNAPRALYAGSLTANVHFSNNEILGYVRPGPIIFDGPARLTHFGPLTRANLPPANVVAGSHVFISDGRSTSATDGAVIGGGLGVPAWFYYGAWRTSQNVF